MCSSCRIVKRGKKVFVVCKENPKHKQRQGFATLVTPMEHQGAAVLAQPLALASPPSEFTAAVLALDTASAVARVASSAGDDGT